MLKGTGARVIQFDCQAVAGSAASCGSYARCTLACGGGGRVFRMVTTDEQGGRGEVVPPGLSGTVATLCKHIRCVYTFLNIFIDARHGFKASIRR
jgi:hypothetical protein